MDQFAVIELLELMRITREQAKRVLQHEEKSVWGLPESIPKALRDFLVYKAGKVLDNEEAEK